MSSLSNLLYVVSNNDSYLAQVADVALSFYEPRTFTDPRKLLDVLYNGVPSALVIDSSQSGISSIELISRVRLLADSDQLPIIFTIAPNRVDLIDEAQKYSGVICLEKPYRRTDLLNSISNQINTTVESSWDKYEPVQRMALKQTLASFSSIADVLAEGGELDYISIQSSCKPLMKAVENNQYQNILDGIRDHHNYTYVHSMRVATMLSLFGVAIGMSGTDHMTLTTGGLLHDVGKMNIPYDILNKKGKLNVEEFILMQDHVRYTINFLDKSRDLPKGARIIASQHHEKLDGTGYPNGYKGREINQLARMACIIDVFSALTDERSYKVAMPPVKAFIIMEDMTGHLDQDLLKIFKGLLLGGALQ